MFIFASFSSWRVYQRRASMNSALFVRFCWRNTRQRLRIGGWKIHKQIRSWKYFTFDSYYCCYSPSGGTHAMNCAAGEHCSNQTEANLWEQFGLETITQYNCFEVWNGLRRNKFKYIRRKVIQLVHCKYRYSIRSLPSMRVRTAKSRCIRQEWCSIVLMQTMDDTIA